MSLFGVPAQPAVFKYTAPGLLAARREKWCLKQPLVRLYYSHASQQEDSISSDCRAPSAACEHMIVSFAAAASCFSLETLIWLV